MAQLVESVSQHSFMLNSFLNHYAAFVEAQTGKPKEEVLKEISESAKADPVKQKSDTILKALKEVLEKSPLNS